MEKYTHILFDHLSALGWQESGAKFLNMLAMLLVLLVFLAIVDTLIRRVILNQFAKIADKTQTQFDDFLVANKVPRNIAHIIPLLIALALSPFIFIDYPEYEIVIEKGFNSGVLHFLT